MELVLFFAFERNPFSDHNIATQRYRLPILAAAPAWQKALSAFLSC